MLKSILSSCVHQTTQTSMKTFAIKSFALLTLAAALLTSCEKSSGTSSYPKWEFDITIDGQQSHFKYSNNEVSVSRSIVSIMSGSASVQLIGNSISDPEWVAGSSCYMMISFEEKIGQQSAVISWDMLTDPEVGEISVQIKTLGTPPDFSSGSVVWGKMCEITIPTQTFNDSYGGNHTISGTIKAIRNT